MSHDLAPHADVPPASGDTRTISLTVNGEAVNRKGQHSIWVNDQYRVCFVWTDNGPDQVEIVDYH